MKPHMFFYRETMAAVSGRFALCVLISLYAIRYVVASVDASVFPANAFLVKNCNNMLGQVLAMASSHCGWAMFPVHQDQTGEATLIRHRRAIEDAMLKMGINLKNEVAILFKKPDGARDGRPMSQAARLVVHKNFVQSSPWQNSEVVSEGRIGPCELIRIQDFIGFDPEAQRPGAAARVEQRLGHL